MMRDNYERVKLGDVVYPVSQTYKFAPNEKVIFINTGDILEGKFLHSNLSDSRILPGQAKKRIKKGDILFSEIRPANKRYAFVDFDADNYVVSTKLMVLRPNDNIDSQYLYIWLTMPSTLQNFQIIAESRSGTFPQITFDSIKNEDLSLPPLSEQKRIANILSSFDNKIEQLKKENNILENIAQSIFKEWFVKYNFPNDNGKPYRDSGGKMIDSELGLIPDGWRVGKLGEICELIMGQSPKGESYNSIGDGIPLLNGALELTSEEILSNKFTTQPTKRSQIGDILFCIRATIGNIHFSDKEYCLGRGVASLRPTEDVRYYIYFLLKNIINTIAVSAEGSVIKGLTKDMIYNYLNVYNKDIAILYNIHTKPLVLTIQNNRQILNILLSSKNNLIKSLMK